MGKTFKQSKNNDKFVGIFPFEFEDKKSDVKIPDKIHLVPVGQWEHDLYGPIIITASDIREFIQNFNAGVRKGVFITAGHEGFEELPAVGWVTEVESRDTGLWGSIEWNELGKKTLSDKQFKYFSPEMCRDYEDPEDHQYYRNVLTGGALTKSPYFKELEAIVFSDKQLKNNFNDKQNMSKTLEEVLALPIADLSDEDKAVLKENADKLTDEQKSTYTAVLDEPKDDDKTETEEEKVAREAKEKEDANVAAGLNPDGTPKEGQKTDPIEASEKGMMQISKQEYSILQDKANKGAEAFAQLEKAEIESAVSAMLFSENNKAGKFLPKSKTAITTFMGKLTKEQRTAFSALVSELPASDKFTEIGEDKGAVDGTAVAEVDAKINAKMKANDKLSYSEALKQVMSENAGLEQRYDSELPSARKSNK